MWGRDKGGRLGAEGVEDGMETACGTGRRDESDPADGDESDLNRCWYLAQDRREEICEAGGEDGADVVACEGIVLSSPE